ncbi:type IX secretion system periplasmic lipoprotein PorW/SprE [Flavobacterium silvaticum]|uniref:Gliding motility protein n=1 Tax=Flavobacterium silvaticum TaxID=1852020 RepID=A0A972FLT7_9FLAO|nr:tetratricopeptide repeat protein [Flavobacterium silvaticum]NMH28366.1 gliding motility protein [Flavobacterium silvaticum]
MKINILKPVVFTGIALLALACSVRRDTWLSRNSHALSTKYNILYNGGLALDAGRLDLQTKYSDNYFEILPIEQMQPAPDVAAYEEQLNKAANPTAGKVATPPKSSKTGKDAKDAGAAPPVQEPVAAAAPAQERNGNFERAETKATKAIQKHSMNIGGSEKNPQMDEAYLMLGQARYYDQRYLPALEAFNYVLYKYPQSSRIYEVKVWREKTNMRLENESQSINNLRKLLKEIKLKDQIFADANATMAQAFLNVQEKDSAIVRLKTAVEFTRKNEEEARYQFIIGQLYESQKNSDSAFAYFQKVIDMKRKGPRMYYIQSILHQSAQFDPKKGDTIAFNEKFDKLLKDRENRGYLDWINFQYALYYDKAKNPDKALKYYNKSLDAGPTDAYLNASNYRNIADIYFNKAKYVTAGTYYDSTMIHLKPRTREFRQIEKKRENLADVIKYESIAQKNDSILKVVAMGKPAQIAYYQEYIDNLKKEDEKRRIAAEKEMVKAENAARDMASGSNARSSTMPKSGSPGLANINKPAAEKTKTGTFYFYNTAMVAMGKQEFKRNWGNRKQEDNWRSVKPSKMSASEEENTDEVTDEQKQAAKKLAEDAEVKYTPDFYISQLPTNQTVLDSLGKERNFAYYQLGVIYKEKFREYPRAADKLEKLLSQNPEERLILPAQYNLYKVYEAMNDPKAAEVRNDILTQYPDSRYAQILSQNQAGNQAALGPDAAYETVFKEYEAGKYVAVLPKITAAIDQYTGEEIVPKLELLKARTVGKMRGLDEYKKALNYVALTYPNSTEGKEAEVLLGRDVVLMEYMQFNDREPKSWKLLFRAPNLEDKKIKVLQEKLKKFISERTADELSQSVDFYTPEMNFVAVHGIKTKEGAQGIASVLKEFKEYKIAEVPIIVSSENYGIIQIKKNLDEYLADPDKPAAKLPPPTVKRLEEAATKKQPLRPRPQKQRATAPSVPASNMPGGAAVPPSDPDTPATGARGNTQQTGTRPGGNSPNMAPPGK